MYMQFNAIYSMIHFSKLNHMETFFIFWKQEGKKTAFS